MANENYGADLGLVWDEDAQDWDLDLNFPLVSEEVGVQHRIYRRLITPRGSLSWAPNEGLCIKDYLGEGLTQTEYAALASQVRSEILNEEAIQDATVVITPGFPEGSYRIDITYWLARGPVSMAFVATKERLAAL